MINIKSITENDELREYEGRWAVLIVHAHGSFIGSFRYFTKAEAIEDMRRLRDRDGYSGITNGEEWARHRDILFMMPVPVKI